MVLKEHLSLRDLRNDTEGLAQLCWDIWSLNLAVGKILKESPCRGFPVVVGRGAERRPAQGVPLDGSQPGAGPLPGLSGQQSGPAGEALQSLLCRRDHQLLPLEPLSEKSAEPVLGSGKEGRKEAASALPAAVVLPYQTGLCRSSGAVALSWISCVGWTPPHLAESVCSVLHICARIHAEHLRGWIHPLDGD